MAHHHQVLLDDPAALDEALRDAATSTEPLWHLAIAATRMIRARRFEDALRIYDVILGYRTLDPSAYCNALWVAQRDNTGLEAGRARAEPYLRHALPHAPTNPPIHLNAAAVLCELGRQDEAMDQLLQAARREVALDEALGAELFAPLRASPRWAELEEAARPLPAFDTPMEAPPDAAVEGLARALDDPDPRVRHRALRRLVWWRDEEGDDGHGRRAPEPLLSWYRAVGASIERTVPTDRLVAVIGRDLGGPFTHTAARSFDILMRNSWPDTGSAIGALGSAFERGLRHGDPYVRGQLTSGLFWISWHPDARAPLERHTAGALCERLVAFAAGPSLSDLPQVERDEIRHAVTVLGHLDRLPEVAEALRTLIAGARGEVADRYLRDDLARALQGT